MEATVVSVGKSVLDGALSYAKSAIAEEVTLQVGVQRDQVFIRDELEMMQSFLVAADKVEHEHHEVVKTWVKQVRDVAYDVEGCLQDYAVRLEKPSWWRLPCTVVRERHHVAKEMKELRAKVEDVSQRNMRYHLLGGPATVSKHSHVTATELQSTPTDDIDATRVAKQQQKVDLVHVITKNGGPDLRVIALWGTSGATVVASAIWVAYQKAKREFECHAWVKLMHPFDAKEFIGSMVSSTEQKDKAESSSEDTTGTSGSTEDGNNPILEEPKPIERKEPDSEVIDLISKGGKVIAVCGMGDDFEKCTALVKNVYKLLGGSFLKCAWFSMKSPFNHEEFLNELVSQLNRDYCKSSEASTDCKKQEDSQNSTKSKQGTTESSTRKILAKILSEPKCLFVFDNISSIEEWDSIVKSLPTESNTANRIIVTTRELAVAIHCSGEEQYTYKLESENDKTTVDSQSVGIDSTEMKSSMASDKRTVHFDDEIIPEDNLEAPPESDHSLPLDRDPNTPAAMNKLTRSRTAKATQEDQLIGRVNEKEVILKLLSGNQGLQVISVWGMGGVGKTTLVKNIYQSSELEKLKFERRAWVTVTRPFQHTEFLRNLAQRLEEDSAVKKGEPTLGISRNNDLSTMRHNDLDQKVKNDLTGKKYLIVVDDLSSHTEWDFIGKFPENNNASRIIITTRPKGVALRCSKIEGNMHNIEGLTDEDALELFLNKVSSNDKDKTELKQKLDMMEEANIIIKKCGRLPLAIAAVGGFLSTRPLNITEWRKFSDHISTELHENPSLEMIKKILISSYEGLPYQLKSCFLYLSIFPEDHDIRYRRLLRRWIAEGYSRATRNKHAEKEAEEQYTALLNKSMIQQSRTVATGKTGFCQVHDLMREISIAKSEEENLVLVLDERSTSSSKDKVRHLVIRQSWSRERENNDMQNIVDVSNIRSLTVFGKWRSFFLCKKMRMLRVLDLEDAEGLQDPDLVPIGKLRHLKYLSLRGSETILNLPSSFGDLLNLETLDIRGTLVTKLPATIGRLQNLKYLHAGIPPYDEDNIRSSALVSTILEEYREYKSDPKGMTIRTFVSYIMLFISSWLRNLDVHGVEVPRGIGRLSSIHTLSIVNIARGKAMLKNLKKLTQLRKLGVTGVNKNNCEELCSAIAGHGRLQSLLLRAEGKVGLEGCLDNMSQPPKDLESLQLYGNLVTLPEWVKTLQNLQKLCLRNTNLKADDTMKVLGNLPMLAILRLQHNACEENELRFGPECLAGLTALELVNWWSLESVKFEGGATPKLKVLLVENCWQIHDDGFSGIETVSSLKEVSLLGYNYDQTYTEFKEQLQQQLNMIKPKPNLKIL
uniref:Uncharacterized protein n=1 Tax=Oryza punctata TaxID=4537 RepID=A0A0E0LXG4_ORYPU